MIGGDVGGGEGGAEKGLGGAVVGRCIESTHTEIKGACYDGVCGEGVGVRVVLVVECCGAADEGREDD